MYAMVADVVKTIKDCRNGEVVIIRTAANNALIYIRCDDIRDIDLIYARQQLLIDVRAGPEIALSITDIFHLRLQNREGWTLKTWEDVVMNAPAKEESE